MLESQKLRQRHSSAVVANRFVSPSLLLAYLGQGARLIRDGDEVLSNLFYKTIPGPANGALFWIIYVFAILATVRYLYSVLSLGKN